MCGGWIVRPVPPPDKRITYVVKRERWVKIGMTGNPPATPAAESLADVLRDVRAWARQGPSAVNWSNPGGAPPWGTLVESGNPICRGCGVRLLTLGFNWVDEVTGSRICGGDPGTVDQSHQSGPPPPSALSAIDATP